MVRDAPPSSAFAVRPRAPGRVRHRGGAHRAPRPRVARGVRGRRHLGAAPPALPQAARRTALRGGSRAGSRRRRGRGARRGVRRARVDQQRGRPRGTSLDAGRAGARAGHARARGRASGRRRRARAVAPRQEDGPRRVATRGDACRAEPVERRRRRDARRARRVLRGAREGRAVARGPARGQGATAPRGRGWAPGGGGRREARRRARVLGRAPPRRRRARPRRRRASRKPFGCAEPFRRSFTSGARRVTFRVLERRERVVFGLDARHRLGVARGDVRRGSVRAAQTRK